MIYSAPRFCFVFRAPSVSNTLKKLEHLNSSAFQFSTKKQNYKLILWYKLQFFKNIYIYICKINGNIYPKKSIIFQVPDLAKYSRLSTLKEKGNREFFSFLYLQKEPTLQISIWKKDKERKEKGVPQCSTFQGTLMEALGYLGCVNYSAIVDMYRACMSCHHMAGPHGGFGGRAAEVRLSSREVQGV